MRITRAKAIRLKCLDCSNQQTTEVKNCSVTDCPLYLYRMGYEVDVNGNKVGGGKKNE